MKSCTVEHLNFTR